MDDYISEKEQIELIRQWWRENGWYLIGGAVVAAVGYFGYNQYQDYRDRVASEAAGIYDRLFEAVDEDRPGVDDLLAELVSDYGSTPYADQGRLLVASDRIVSDPDRAIEELRAVMDASDDPGLSMIARTRLARVLAYRERYDEALAVLEVEEPGEFTAQINQIRGDIHAARGDAAAARLAYTAALTGRGAEGLDRNLLQMKLSDLSTAGAAAGAAPVPASGGAGDSTGSAPAGAQSPGDETGAAPTAPDDAAGEAPQGAADGAPAQTDAGAGSEAPAEGP